MEKLKFKIRPATKKDKDILVDFRHKLDMFEHSKNHLHPKETKKDVGGYVSRCLGDRKYFFFLAEVDGKPVGFSAATIWTHGKRKKLHGSLEVTWVEPAFRRQGIARALSEVRIKKLNEYKPEKIRAYINPDNIASQKNIKSFGAEHIFNVYEIKPKKKA